MNTQNEQVYWGDLHTHFTPDFASNEEQLRSGMDNIDFCCVLFYPFEWREKNGFNMETTQNLSHFYEAWDNLQELCRDYNQPEQFVTFPGYEWHGNRGYYGDHNVVYFSENNPLDDSWDLTALYKNLEARGGMAIPHHTAYQPGNRGVHWEYTEPTLSPVMEIYSTQGSSEGCDTPEKLSVNKDMGPRCGGGSFQDALQRGHEIGVIGSNDGGGLPGRWGRGRAGVWAPRLDREHVWRAIQQRRTYAVTGDRIELDFTANGHVMGESFSTADTKVAISGRVKASQDIDRIELVTKDGVIDSYRPEQKACGAGRYKLKIEMGWGPGEEWGFQDINSHAWNGELFFENGSLRTFEKCFTRLGQKVQKKGTEGVELQINTPFKKRGAQNVSEAILLEFDGSPESRLKGTVEGINLDIPVKELLNGGQVVPLLNESKDRIFSTFDLNEADIINTDSYYHNARKIKLHRLAHQETYETDFYFSDVDIDSGKNWYYVRVHQVNGQKAWSSPVWIRKE